MTNRGRFLLLGYSLRGTTIPTNFYVALATAATIPTDDTNLMSDLTEIAAGNGYTSGGFQLTPNSTDFDVHTEDDANDLALIQMKDISWTASGGDIPASGSPARWAVLTTDEVTVANRQILAWFDLIGNVTIASGTSKSLANLTVRLKKCT